jgi:ribosomal protein L3
MVKGSIPGKKNSIVYLKDSVKKSSWKYQCLI